MAGLPPQMQALLHFLGAGQGHFGGGFAGMHHAGRNLNYSNPGARPSWSIGPPGTGPLGSATPAAAGGGSTLTAPAASVTPPFSGYSALLSFLRGR